MSGQASADTAQGVEYSIYVFDQPQNSNDNSKPRWQKIDTLDDRSKLAGSGKYEKIEVKQKYFDKKKNRDIDVTLKTFSVKKKKDYSLIFLIGAAILCGAIAFALTYFLTKNV